jgi:HD-like signal output (HDOD) protein
MMRLELSNVLPAVNKLPSLPTVVMELLASLDQEDINIDALAAKISQDQALTAKTLRLANSSFYGMAHQITTIAEAIAILGFRTVRIATTLPSAFGASARLLVCAILAPLDCQRFARELAAHLEAQRGAGLRTGLLYDIGRWCW